MRAKQWLIVSYCAVSLFGCSTLINRYCMYVNYTPEFVEGCEFDARSGNTDSSAVNAKQVHIPFPYELRPQVTSISFSTAQDPNNDTLRREVYCMDGQNYESVQAIVDELDRRRPQLMEAGIYCPYSGGKATWQKPLEVNSVIYQYCVKNDVDLFTSFPMGLPPLDNLRNIHWVVQSSKTKNVLPETISIMPSHEVEKKIKPPKRTRAQIL